MKGRLCGESGNSRCHFARKQTHPAPRLLSLQKNKKKQSTAEGLKSKFKQTLCQSPGSLCEWSGSRFCLTDNNLGFPIFEESCSGLFLNIFFTENNEQSGGAGKKNKREWIFFFFFFAPRTICDTEQMSGLCMQMLNCCYITDDGNQRGNTFQR